MLVSPCSSEFHVIEVKAPAQDFILCVIAMGGFSESCLAGLADAVKYGLDGYGAKPWGIYLISCVHGISSLQVIINSVNIIYNTDNNVKKIILTMLYFFCNILTRLKEAV